MAKIMPTSQLQKQIGQIADYGKENVIILTNHGVGTSVMLPYFDDNDEAVDRYMEDFTMHKNRQELQARYQESHDSGCSDLVIE